MTAFAGLVVVPAAHASPAVRFTNPLAERRADPRIFKQTARVEADVNPLADSQFRIVTGLDGSGTALFKNDAGFFQRAGLADSAAVSFESQNFPGRYLRHNGTTGNLTTATDPVARADSTFILA
ncbi:AbfB domain-containing protein [Actinosynnema sp. CA-248983]